MPKKRGKTAKKTKPKAAKKVKSSFQEKKITYAESPVSHRVKDEELHKQLKELETGRYYGYRERNSSSQVKKEASKPVERQINKPKAGIFPKQFSDKPIPTWFYISSIFVSFLFVIYISIFATIHFGSIEHMNITIIFLFIAMVSYFLISAIYMVSENKKQHAIPPVIFFVGVVSIMIYAFKAVDTSDLVRFSIIYTIIVSAISAYVLAIKR